MSRGAALEAYRALPIPDMTEEHWRFTDLRGFDPDQAFPSLIEKKAKDEAIPVNGMVKRRQQKDGLFRDVLAS